MKWQRKQANPANVLFKVEKIHNDQIDKEPTNHKCYGTTEHTHTKANDGVRRAIQGIQPNEDYLLKCHRNTRRTLAQFLLVGNGFAQDVNTLTFFGGTYKR